MAKSSLSVSSISLDDIPGPGPPVSPVLSVLHNSPFYSPVRDSPSQGGLPSTFSTFHPQLRTSPEGSSCGDTEPEQQTGGGQF